MTDITEQGAQNYKDLQDQNNQDFTTPKQEGGTVGRLKLLRHLERVTPSVRSTHYNELPLEFGDSKYDRNERVPMYNLKDLENYRGEKQSGLAQLGAGAGKCLALAGTTFLDGTVGLIAGLASPISKGTSGLWADEVSVALQTFNQNMEKWLPNYRTETERNNKWWQNFGTMNFWADGLLKNMGFTIGAFYSGNAWLGALKGIKALSMAAKAGKAIKTAEAAAKTSGLGAEMLGSFLSGFNEARIEAYNNSKDFLDLESQKIETAYNQRLQEIQKLPEGEQTTALEELETNKTAALQDAKKRSDSMGLADLIGNTAILTVSNMWQFGKLYRMGFNNAKGIAGKIAAGRAIESSPVKKIMTPEGIKYVAKEVAGGWKGVSNAIMEGLEEMNQKWIATSSGIKRTTDSPEAYYTALTNPESQKNAFHTSDSFVKGLVDTYGNFDNYEEFAIGFITGALGMPTVGKVNNSSANTWAFRGRGFGISGGIGGELRSAKEYNKNAKNAETAMNRLMEKLNKNQSYFVMSNSFTEAMDGYAADGNKFEYKNAENNDDFASTAAFANAGRMDDLLEIVNQDYENMSREELQNIAMHTTPNLQLNDDGSEITKDEEGNIIQGGWRDPKTGKLLTSTEEGTEQMRQKLIQKRDDILQGIKDYSQAVSEVRARANGALSDSQIEELSWMNWKIKQFKNRYNCISSENKDFINKMKSAIDNTITSINRIKEIDELLQKQPGETELQKKARIKELNKGREKTLAQERRSLLRKGINSLDLSTENGQAFFKALGVLSEYFGVLQSDRSLEDLGLIISNNKDITDVLQNDEIMEDVLKYISGVDSDTYAKAMEGIGDMAKIGIAAKSFMDKYIEFMTNPLSQQKHREKIDKKQKNKKDLKDAVDVASELDKMEINEIVAKIKDGSEIPQELKDKLDEASKAKLDEADKIIEAYQKRLKDIEESDAPDEVKNIAIAQLEDSLGRAKSVKELFDTEKQAYLDREVARQASGNEPFTEERAAKLEQAIEDARELHMNFNEKDAEEALNKAEEGPEAAVKKGEESEETPGADPHAKSKSEQQLKAERKKTTKSEDNEKIRELKSKLIRGAHTAAFTNPSLSTLSDDDLEKAVNFTFSQIKKHAKTNTFADIIDDIKETDQGKIALMAVPISDDSSVNLEELYNLYKEDIEEEEKPQSEKREQAEKGKKQELMTAVSDDEDIDATDPENIDPEARELFLRYKGKKKQYWRRNIPEFAYVPYAKDKTKKVPIPYDEYVDKYLKNKPYAKRDKEVYRLLKEDGAFERRNSGKVKEGTIIHFITKPDWNRQVSEATGNKEIVILMAVENENGKLEVVGDVSSKYTNEVIEENSPGLPAFVDRFEAAYNKAGKVQDDYWEYKAETTTVGKVLVGTVQYSEDNHTLNKIFGGDKFELGIIVDDGGARTVRTSNTEDTTDKDNSILSPRSGKRGQTVLLIPTNSGSRSKKYITVRVTPQRFNLRLHKDTTYYNALKKAVEGIVTADGFNKQTKAALEDLLCIPDNFSIRYDEDGNFAGMTLYSSREKEQRKNVISQRQLINLSAEEIVDKILKKLSDEQLLIRVDLKYINDNYKLGRKTIDYNSMIGEVCTTNLPVGTTHTVNNWFITSYSQEDNGEFKEYFDAKDVKSLKFNPTPSGRITAKVNSRKKVATSDDTEETKEEKEVKKKAKEAVKKTPKRIKQSKVSKVTKTLEDNEEVTEVEEMHKTGESDSKGNVIRTDDECDEAFKLSSLPKNTKTKEAWADLTSEQKNKILDLPKVKQKACVQTLVSAHSKGGFYESRLIGNSVDATIASYSPKESKSVPKLRAVSREASKVADNARERRIIERALPQLSNKEVIRIHKGLIKISKTAKPEYAWGKFQEGIITLSDIAARGTLYHESFHFVFNSLLTDEEIVSMYNAAKDIYGDKSLIELEELMAEDFRRFMQFQEDLQEAERTGNTREWDRIKREIKSLLHKLEGNTHVLNSVFSKIYNKEYANRSVVYRDAATVKEMADIKEKAIADGTFMKAPNGKPTNLTERQWLQVRTKAFKDWFGDWEKYAPKSDATEKLLSKLNNIANSDSRYDVLAKLILDNNALPYNLKYFKIDNNRDDIEGHSAMWHSLANLIEILGNNVSEEEINKALLHELIHYNTENFLSTYRTSPENVPQSIRQNIKELYSIIDYAKKYITEHFNENKFREIAERQNSNVGSRVFYAFDNQGDVEIDEFISEIFTNPGLQEVLNEIPYKETKQTLWDRIKECIQNIFGLPINRGSVLDEALKASTEFITKANKDYNSVSKVVDENGEPLVVYHGTRNKKGFNFNAFNKYGSKVAGYFTNNEEVAESYNADVREFFLNIRNPEIIDAEGKDYGVEDGIRTIATGEMSPLNNIHDGRIIRNIDDFQYKSDNIVFSDYDSMLEAENQYIPENTLGDDYIVKYPNQIKSATDNIGTFSEDDDIRYRRFETTQEYDEEIQKLDKELDQKTPKVENELNDTIQQFKEKYNRVKERLANIPVIVLNNKHYYAVNTGRSVDSQYYGELYKSTLMKDYLEGIGDVISYKGYYFDIIPVLRTNAQFKDYVLEHNSELRDAYDEVNYLDEELARLEVEKDDLEMSKKYEEELAQRRIQRLQYENLSEAEKDILKSAGITEESWEEMTIEEKENRKRCLF